MGRTGENITCGKGVQEEMQIFPDFRDFVTKSYMRFIMGDWGEVDPEDAEHNRKNQGAAIGAYTYNGEIKIYIKSEFLGTTVFFPDEY